DGVLLKILHHVEAGIPHAGLGVTHRRRVIAVDRTEVALPVDQRIPHREILRQANHGIVYGGVAVRVVLAGHLPDDTRTLAVGAVRPDAHVVHPVQYAPVSGFQAIKRDWQRATDREAPRVM